MTTIEKILKVLEAKGISPTKAERLIGVSQGVLTKAIERKGSVHDATQEKFIRHFRVRRTWWEAQKGDMFDENLTPVNKGDSDLREEIEELRVLNTHYKNKIRELTQKLEDYEAGKRGK